MTVPTYDRFIEPLLRFLASRPEGVLAGEAHEAVAGVLGLSAQDRLELLPSGAQPVYKNRAGWAHDRLKRARLSTSPRRGYWRLSESGKSFVAQHGQPLSADALEKLALGFIDVRLKPSTSSGLLNTSSALPPPQPLSVESPDDRLAQALAELRSTVAAELLETLAAVSPSYFESIVLDLLHRMGYGASRSDLQRVGGVGDGGIDGVIALDRLGQGPVHTTPRHRVVTRIAAGKAQTAAGLDTRRGFATPPVTILATTLREGPPKRATRRCITCPHASAGGALRLDWPVSAGLRGASASCEQALEKVYVQAKRWQGVVGRPEIQAFYGALAGQRAKKGVFITTSSYTAQAVEFARSVEGIVLVDGSRLADLMIENEIGVSARTIKVPKLDSDYFDEDAA